MKVKTAESKTGIKRRNFFYYIGAAALGAVVFNNFPFSIFKRSALSGRKLSIKVNESPYSVKRTAKVSAASDKGSMNG